MKEFTTRFFVVLVSILVASSAFGFEQDQAVIGNDEVVRMVSAGLGDEVIIAMISSSRTSFDTSIESILSLREGGVSEEVLTAMIGASASTSETTSVTGRQAGIYLEAGEGELVLLEPSVISAQRSGGILSGITGVVPRGRKGIVRTGQARQRLLSDIPVFYFYFESPGAGLSNTGGIFSGYMQSASSPNEFVMVKLKEKDHERELDLGRDWVFGSRTGINPDKSIHFDFERLETGVYRVTLLEPLEEGEYAFLFVASPLDAEVGQGKIFDFGLDEEVADSRGR